MMYGIEDRLEGMSRAEVCKGMATDAVLFDYDIQIDTEDDNGDGEEVTEEETDNDEVVTTSSSSNRVAQSLLDRKKDGRSLSRYSKALR